MPQRIDAIAERAIDLQAQRPGVPFEQAVEAVARGVARRMQLEPEADWMHAIGDAKPIWPNVAGVFGRKSKDPREMGPNA